MNANQSYKVYFIKRQANIVTHTLARASRSYANPQTFDYVLTLHTLFRLKCNKFVLFKRKTLKHNMCKDKMKTLQKYPKKQSYIQEPLKSLPII